MSAGAPDWAIDNVFIGGTEVNPSEFIVDFDGYQNQDISSGELIPLSEAKINVCGLQNTSLYWREGDNIKSYTTEQLIVQRDYMIQFKVVIIILMLIIFRYFSG